MPATIATARAVVRLNCLGPASLAGPGGAPLMLRTRKQLALLFYLARRARPIGRDELIDLFWSEDPEKLARHSLSQCCSLINKVLGAEVIVTAGRDRVGVVADAVALDITEFESLVAAGAHAEAIRLWRGLLFEGLWVQRAPHFERWLSDEREKVQRLYRRLAHVRIEALRNAGDHQAMRDEADRLLQYDPLDEKAMLACLEALTLAGDRSLALRRYGDFEARLRKELEAEPGAALRSWAKRLRKGEGSGAPRERLPAPRISEITVLPAVQPFFGRAEEFAMLWKAWETAGTGKGAFIIIEGEAGIGKTALATKLVNQAHVAGGSVCFVKCYRTEKSVPFAPITALIRQLSRLPGFVALDPVWIGELTRLVPELRERYPNVPQPMAVDDAARHRLSDAAVNAALAVADEQSLLIALDDLQDADEASLALVHYLARQAHHQPVFVVGARRTQGGSYSDIEKAFFDSQAKLGRTLALAGLGKEEVERLVQQVVAKRGLHLGSLEVVRIVALTAGNPLRAIEAASRSDQHSPARSTTKDGFDASAVDRLRQLSRPAYSVACAVSLAGRPMSEYELSSVSSLGVADLASALQDLEAEHLLQRTGTGLGLVHERYGVALDSLMNAELRAEIHLRLAQLLRRSADRNPAARFDVASHFAAANRPKEARAQALRAAQYARSLGAVRERAAALELAMTATGSFDRELAADLGECFLELREFDQLRRTCDQVVLAKDELSLPPDFKYLRIAADYHAGLTPLPELASELSLFLTKNSGFKLEAAACTLSMRLAYRTANPPAVRLAFRALRKTLRKRGIASSAYALQATGYIAAKFYSPKRALPLLCQALDAARRSHDLDLEHLIRCGIGAVYRQLGMFKESIRELETALALAQGTLNAQLQAADMIDIAVAELSRDNLERSSELLAVANAILEEHPDRVVYDLLHANRAELYLQQGKLQESKELYEIVLQRSLRSGDQTRAIQILGGLGLCLQRIGDNEALGRRCAEIERLDGTDPLISHERGLLEAALAWNVALNEGDPGAAIVRLEIAEVQLHRRDVDHWLFLRLEKERIRNAFGMGDQASCRELAATARAFGADFVARVAESSMPTSMP